MNCISFTWVHCEEIPRYEMLEEVHAVNGIV